MPCRKLKVGSRRDPPNAASGCFLPEILPEGNRSPLPAILPEGFRAEVVTISGMARQADTYTAAQAAQILGISERRVRQLVNEGKLSGNRAEDGTVRLPQQAVNDERKRRRGATATKTPATRTRKR